MVFTVRTKTLVLEWDESTEWPGLQVECRGSLPLGRVLEFQAATRRNEPEEMRDLLRDFGNEVLVAWNAAAESGEDFPATGDGLLALPDSALALNIVTRWGEAIQGVAAPLGQPSRAPSTLAARSTTRETLS